MEFLVVPGGACLGFICGPIKNVDGIPAKCLKSVWAVIGLTLVKSDKLLNG